MSKIVLDLCGGSGSWSKPYKDAGYWEFGDPYTKGTDIWGYFNFPTKKYKNIDEIMTEEQKAKCSMNSRRLPSISEITGSKQQAKRSITPAGFANSFFRANK